MKSTIKAFLIFLLSAFLISCNSMSNQDVGTLAGGVAGGILGSTIGHGSGRFVAIAAGTLAGALVGGAIGRNMDETDRLRMMHALDYNPVGEPAYWRNANTGVQYNVVPVRNVSVQGNRYCREYQTTANIGGKKQQIYGTACRQPDGSWQAVR